MADDPVYRRYDMEAPDYGTCFPLPGIAQLISAAAAAVGLDRSSAAKIAASSREEISSICGLSYTRILFPSMLC